MKLHFTSDWLRSHIDNDPDIECEAGFPLLGAEPLSQFVGAHLQAPQEESPEQKPYVLYQLVRQLRRRDGLTRAQLAAKIRIDAREIETIEAQPEYVPKPRTVHQLADYIGVPTKAVEQLTSAANAPDNVLAEAAHRFAASSDDLSKLTRAEKKRLDDFVKILASFN
ncbi:MAG: helix-turn-helix transcriptional regulator [Rhodospirillales bacterium]